MNTDLAKIVFEGSIGGFSWNNIPEQIPGYLGSWKTIANTSNRVVSSWHNSTRTTSSIHSLVVTAALMMVADENTYRPGSGVVKVSEAIYAAEYHHSNQTEVSFIIYDAEVGIVKGGLLQNGITMSEHAAFNAGKGAAKANGTALMQTLLAAQYDRDDEIRDAIDVLKAQYASSNPDGDAITDALFLLSDAMYFGIKDRKIPLEIPGNGDITRISKRDIDNGAFTGIVIAGKPALLTPSKTTKKKAAAKTIGGYATNPAVERYRAEHCSSWTAEEEQMIPVFDETMPVPPEVSYMLTALLGSEDNLRPIRNILWRGTSGYGKSTGVEMLAAILHKPLLRFTCSSTTEKQDFLTAIMPDVSAKPALKAVSFAQIANDPEGAYEALTGKEAPEGGVDCNTVFEEAVKRMAAAGSTTPRYIMQESTYIRALKHGYIIEVQEASRIRDAGVLPGLNEYDRPGALIPQVDGTFVPRHRDAFVIYTDNVGFNSCNELDPAVLRRMAIVIDSEDMSRDDILARIKRNLSAESLKEVVSDNKLLVTMYDIWKKVQTYCKDHDLLSAGGCVTIEELERWIQMTAISGRAALVENLQMCVIGKATTDWDEQKSIREHIKNLI